MRWPLKASANMPRVTAHATLTHLATCRTACAVRFGPVTVIMPAVEATTKAMPVIVEEERQSRQGHPAGARRAGGHQDSGTVMDRHKEPSFVDAICLEHTADVTVLMFTSTTDVPII